MLLELFTGNIQKSQSMKTLEIKSFGSVMWFPPPRISVDWKVTNSELKNLVYLAF